MQRRLLLGCAALLLVALVSLQVGVAQAASANSKPKPIGTIHTSHGDSPVYAVQQVLALPNIHLKRVLTTGTASYRVRLPGPRPDTSFHFGNETLTVTASITYVFQDNEYVCGFSSSATWTSPDVFSVSLISTLWVAGDAFDTYTAGGSPVASGSTACYYGELPDSLWHQRTDAYAWNGITQLVHGWADVYAYQP